VSVGVGKSWYGLGWSDGCVGIALEPKSTGGETKLGVGCHKRTYGGCRGTDIDGWKGEGYHWAVTRDYGKFPIGKDGE
jgi:hypothetical protein